MPPNRFVEMFTRGGRRGRTADDEGGDRRGATGRSEESTRHTHARPTSAGAMTSFSRVALISVDGTADGSGVAPERSDAEMGLTTGFTPRRRLPSADDRRRRAASAGMELGNLKQELGGGARDGGQQKAPNTQQQQQRHAGFLLPLPPLPARLRRRTSTANGCGSGANTPHSRRGDSESSHSTLAVDATAADVPPADPAPPRPPSLLRAVPQWWRVAILWFKSELSVFSFLPLLFSGEKGKQEERAHPFCRPRN